MSRRKETILAVSCWLAVATILGAVCFFSAGVSEGAEVVDPGVINEGTRICESDSITPDIVEMFERYKSIIDKLEEVGIDNMTSAERMLGAFLSNEMGCGTVAVDYRVVVSFVKGDYVLFFFDEVYEYERQQYLTRLESFHADELL